MTWTGLDFTLPLSVGTAQAALRALAGVSGQPRIVLEAVGSDSMVTWRLGCEAWSRGRVLDSLTTQVAGLVATPLPSTFDGLRVDMARAIRLRARADGLLNVGASQRAIRGLLGALSRASHGERLQLQVILGPRQRPSRPHPAGPQSSPFRIAPVDSRTAAEKLREYRFGCEIRIGASGTDPASTIGLIQGVVGALRHLEAPGVRVVAIGSSTRAIDRARSPLLWPNQINVSELAALTGWPVTEDRAAPLPGVPSPHPRRLRVGSGVATRGRVVGVALPSKSGSGQANAVGRPVAISVNDSLRHLHVLGPTGVGKSTLLANLALQDAAAGRGVVVVDPKGDLVDDILSRLDKSRLDDVVVLDARDQAPVGLNPLARVQDADLTADVLLGMFHSLYADAWGPRTHDVLHASLLTLARRGDASIAMVPLLMTNPGFRRSIVGSVSRTDPLGLGGFWAWWEGISEAERQQATAPLMRRLRPILMRPGIRAILGQRAPRFDISDVFTKRRILLVSLARGIIGPEAAELLGSLVVSQLWTAALGRAAISPEKRRPVMVYVDEVQDYLRLPGDLSDALAQARGLGVGYTLAHQHLDQLPKALHAGVMANARSRIAFQLSGRDARELAGLSRGALQPDDFESLPAYEAYAQLLTDNQPTGWISLATTPMREPLRSPDELRHRASQTYGQLISEVEADLLSLLEPTRPHDESIGRATRRRLTDDPSDGSAS